MNVLSDDGGVTSIFITLTSAHVILCAIGLLMALFYILSLIRTRIPITSPSHVALGIGRLVSIVLLAVVIADSSWNVGENYFIILAYSVLTLILLTSFVVMQNHPTMGFSLSLKIGKILFVILLCFSISLFLFRYVFEHFNQYSLMFFVGLMAFWFTVLFIWGKNEERKDPPTQETLDANRDASADVYWRMQDSRYEPPPPGGGGG